MQMATTMHTMISSRERTDEKGTTVLRRARQAETASHINKRVSSHDYGRPCH